jgi:hypothetical protein
MSTLALPRFAPDLSNFNSKVTDRVVNLLPTPDGWGSMKGFAAIGTGLPDECRGAITVGLSDGSFDIYAGTYTKLYRYNTGTASFDDVSRAVGGDYGLAEGEYWSFSEYEDINGNRLIATNGVDAPQFIDIDIGTNFAALPDAPIAKYCAVVGDFLVLANLSTDPHTVAWSGIKNSEYWNYGYNGSDIQPLADGGIITGLIGLEGGGVIFQSRKVREMAMIQSELVFRISVMHETIGCFAPWSSAYIANRMFWYDQGGFFMGREATPIGEHRVNKYVRDNFDDDNLKLMVAAIDPVGKTVWWAIPRADGTRARIGYNWIVDEWTYSDIDVAYIFPAITPGYTIDSIYDVLGYTMDEIPYTFDSSFWSGSGIESLAGFEADGTFGYFQTTPAEAIIETNDLEFTPGGESFLRSVGLVIDTDRSNVSVQIGTTDVLNGTVTWSTAETLNQYSGRAFPRLTGRTHRIRFTIASSTWNNMRSIEYAALPSGSYE